MKELVYVGAGGFLGTVVRYGVQLWLQPASSIFPMAVLFINLVGCLFLGWFFTVTPAKWRIPAEWRLLIGTGFTGAFTTFSTFTVDSIHLLENEHIVMAAAYILLSVFVGLFMSYIGIKIGEWMVRPRLLKENKL
ncbi:fluoride efflux transporter CrcB [Paenibacillus sp. Marseille-Q4541]|uniref:fluoride efflux transporter CrcB n=1 Tax=Paenibacillus sp. Marseille-Q4541 TaxID=2831522 RepID=UPI001BA93A1E|nr:fluoride efflux transporter CrcB [Paenibacillus sp. Marseille-Q4541]